LSARRASTPVSIASAGKFQERSGAYKFDDIAAPFGDSIGGGQNQIA